MQDLNDIMVKSCLEGENCKTQQEFLEKILKLKKEYLEAEICFVTKGSKGKDIPFFFSQKIKSVWLDKIVKDSFIDKSMQGRPLSYSYTGEQFGLYDLNDELPDTRDEHLAIVVMLEDD